MNLKYKKNFFEEFSLMSLFFNLRLIQILLACIVFLLLVEVTSAQYTYGNSLYIGNNGSINDIYGDECISVTSNYSITTLTFNTSCESINTRNIFNQWLNTTSNVTFNQINSKSYLVQSLDKLPTWEGFTLWTNVTGLIRTGYIGMLNDGWLQVGLEMRENNTADTTEDIRFTTANGVYNMTFNKTGLYNNYFVGDGSRLTNITRNIFNQNLNTSDNVEFRNMTIQNISISDRLYGKKIRLNDEFTGATFPLTTIDFTTTFVSLFGIPLIRMTGGNSLLNVGGIANGLYLLPIDTSNVQLTLANASFTGNWVFSNNVASQQLELNAQDNIGSTFLDNYKIALRNPLNNTKDICVTNGVCLNKTLEISRFFPIKNHSILYYNNTQWVILNKTPTTNQALVYCNNGGMSWIDNTAGVCPL